MKRGGVLTAADREALSRFPPQIDPDDLRWCFTFTPADFTKVIDRRYGTAAQLAAGLQIGALRLLGFVPADLSTAPTEVLRYVANQVGASPSDLADYTTRRATLAEHLTIVENHVGFRRADQGDLKLLGDWLTERALEHDRPRVLFRLACEFLEADHLVRPGVTVVERAVIAARRRATTETYQRLASQLADQTRHRLERLLEVQPDLGMTELVWIRRSVSGSLVAQIRERLVRIELLRSVGADQFDVGAINPNRICHLAGLGRRMTPQGIARLKEARRYPILVATVIDELVRLTDEVLDLFDVAIATVDRNARRDLDEINRTNATVANDTVRLFGDIARVLLDSNVADIEVRATIFDQVDRNRFTAAAERAAEIERPADGSYLDLLSGRYRQVRRFAPQVLAAFTFRAATPGDPLLAAVDLLKELNATRARRVPADAPLEFAPTRWKRFITTGDHVDRHRWELAVLTQLRGALRGANLWVENSRRYQNPTNYLIPLDRWERLRPEFPAATGIPLDPNERINELHRVLTRELHALDGTLGEAQNVRIENDRLVVAPLRAEHPPPGTETLRHRIGRLLPEIDLVDLLVEVNSWCGFLDELVHATHRPEPHTPGHASRLLAALVANGCNFGHATLARIAGFSPDKLAWTHNWYLRTETLRSANARIVDYQTQQPITRAWGSGTLSSSDGQRFPMVANSPRARAMRKYFTGSGATIYTWTSDRHAQYGTRIIPTTVREATYVLDAIFDNETTLTIGEHTTDTAGYTDLIFGLFDLTGLRFSPRIRDLADQRLWRLPTTPTNTTAAGLLHHRINTRKFIDHWDTMLRVAATIRHGHLPASLLVSRLQASARQNHLTRAIQEYGRLIKTISLLRYLHDEEHRRRIHRQLNKGETLHALRRQIFFANQGQIRRRRTEDQDTQSECLTLLTNAIIAWNTTYTAAAVQHLNTPQTPIPDHHLAHLSPATHKHINLYGRYDFTNPTPLPPPGQLRPLRTP